MNINEMVKELHTTRSALFALLVKYGLINEFWQPTERGLRNDIKLDNGMLMIGSIAEKVLTANPESCKAFEKVPAYKNFELEEFVIADTETTGLGKQRDGSLDEIIEISAVSMEGKVLYHSYFYPDVEVNPDAAKVNHLSKEKLSEYGKFVDGWMHFKAAVAGKRILGHNISFDERMIAQTLRKQGYPNADTEVSMVFDGSIDTKKLAKEWMDVKSYSLNNLTSYIGITREEQHDATDDCIMTKEFLDRLDDVITIRETYEFVKSKNW